MRMHVRLLLIPIQITVIFDFSLSASFLYFQVSSSSFLAELDFIHRETNASDVAKQFLQCTTRNENGKENEKTDRTKQEEKKKQT